MKIKEIVNYLDTKYPLEVASDFDQGKIGLVIGNPNIEVKNILLTLDLTIEVLHEALKLGANLIISHHPLIFEPITKVLYNDKIGEIIHLMCKNDLALYAMHTNLDVNENGVNWALANILGLQDISGEASKESFLRCGYLETILHELLTLVKNKFNLQAVRFSGTLDQKINKIGVVGGSGAHKEIIDETLAKGCDVLITGEVKLHMAQYAKYHKLALIEVNHGVEKLVFTNIKTDLEANLNLKTKVYISEINTDPLMAI